jgi:hypothetical protein
LHSQNKVIKCAAYVFAQGRGGGMGGYVGGRMDIRGLYRFSSLVKQNKKAKICFVIYIAGFFFEFFFVMK